MSRSGPNPLSPAIRGVAACVLAGLCAAFAPASGLHAQATAVSSNEAPSSTNESTIGTQLLEYTHVHHMLEEQDPVPLLRIHADGRVLVHYPVYMARAGDYTSELGPSELRSLFDGLAADGLLSVDLRRSRQERGALAALEATGAGELRHVSDTTETIIQVWPQRLSDWESPSGPSYDRTIRWPNVHTDVRYYPEIEAVAAISRAEERLQQLIEHVYYTDRRQP